MLKTHSKLKTYGQMMHDKNNNRGISLTFEWRDNPFLCPTPLQVQARYVLDAQGHL